VLALKGNQKTVLVADDDPAMRDLISRMLSPEMKVIGVSDGQQAIDFTETRMPDLILMDILMPKIDGYAACVAIKSNQKTRSIPLIMLSGAEYNMNVELSRQMGADAYLCKPFSVEELKDTIHKHI
jgi:CheY-like chemotaxis protein